MNKSLIKQLNADRLIQKIKECSTGWMRNEPLSLKAF